MGCVLRCSRRDIPEPFGFPYLQTGFSPYNDPPQMKSIEVLKKEMILASEVKNGLKMMGKSHIQVQREECLGFVFHYTDRPGHRAIFQNYKASIDWEHCGEEMGQIHASRLPYPDNPRDPCNRDAVFGPGVYATRLPPETPRAALAANNYFDLLKHAGVPVALLIKAINMGKDMPAHELLELEENIKNARADLWGRTECCIAIIPWHAYAAVNMPMENGGPNRSIVLLNTADQSLGSMGKYG